jgi:hypothetical protein
VRQMEIRTVKLLVPDPGPSEFKNAVAELKNYK